MRLWVALALVLSARAMADDPTFSCAVARDAHGGAGASIQSAQQKREGAIVEAFRIRGLGRSDLLMVTEVPMAPKDPVGARALVGRDGGPPLLVDRRGEPSDVAIRSAAGSLRFYEEDAGMVTIKCRLTRLLEASDPSLVELAEEYGALVKALDRHLTPADFALALVATTSGRPAPSGRADLRLETHGCDTLPDGERSSLLDLLGRPIPDPRQP